MIVCEEDEEEDEKEEKEKEKEEEEGYSLYIDLSMECEHTGREKPSYCRTCKMLLCADCGTQHLTDRHLVGHLYDEALRYGKELEDLSSTLGKRLWVLDCNVAVIRKYVAQGSSVLLKSVEDTLAELQVTLPQDIHGWESALTQELAAIAAYTDAFHNQHSHAQHSREIAELITAKQTERLGALFINDVAQNWQKESTYLAMIAERTKAIKKDAINYVKSMKGMLNAVSDLKGLRGRAGVGVESLAELQKTLTQRIQELRASVQEEEQKLQKSKAMNLQLYKELQVLQAERLNVAERTGKLRQESEELKRRLEDQRAEYNKLNMENMYYQTKLQTQKSQMPPPPPPPQVRKQPGHVHYFVPLSNQLQVYSVTENKMMKHTVKEHKIYDNFDSVQLPDKIFFCGGYNIGACKISNETYEYDISKLPTVNVTRKADMRTGRSSHKLVAMQEKSLYSLGGQVKTEYYNVCECYDIATNQWTSIAPLTEKKSNVAAATFEESVIYVFGGFNGRALETIERWSVVEGKWKAMKVNKADNWVPRFGAGCLQVSPTALLIWGGLNADKAATASCYCYNTSTERVSALPSAVLLKTKEWFFMRPPVIHNEQLFVFGFHSAQLHRFDIQKQVWDLLTPS